MLKDLRYALRQLHRLPTFTVVAVLTLGLGIGAAAAMLALIQGVLLAPLPFDAPDRLVLITPERADGVAYDQRPTGGQWLSWRDRARTLDTLALYRWTFNFLVTSDGSQSMGGMVVSPDFLEVVGVRPALGRGFVDADAAREDRPASAVILGHELWQRRFAADPAIVGRTIRISRMEAPLPVVGVLPPGVRFLPDPAAASEPNYDLDATVDFWLAAAPDESRIEQRGWNVIARLHPSAGVEEARREIAAITADHARTDPGVAGLTAGVQTVRARANVEGRRLLLPLLGAVTLLFVIACANVTGLLLARGLHRQPEYAMRAALGAGRWRLFRQVLAESALLALVGALAGAIIAALLLAAIRAVGGAAIPRAETMTAGWPLLIFGVLGAMLATALAGVLPAARAACSDRVLGLRSGRTTAGRSERRLLGAVAALQVVLTVALLGGAALLVRTGANLAAVEPGYDTGRVLAMTVTAVQPGGWRDFHTRALERVSTIPGVTHAAFVWGLPLTGNKWPGEVTIVGESRTRRLADRLSLPLRAVTEGYFEAMHMAVVEGRGFRPTDDQDAPRVAVVNEAMARVHLGGGRAIGRSFTTPFFDEPIEIVGVVRDARTESLSEDPGPEIYVSLWQNAAYSKHLIVRSSSDPRALTARVRDEIRAVDPTAAVEHVTTMAQVRRESVATRTFATRLLTWFAVAATLLALVGLYGVLSLSVGLRTREIAVRKAMGARQPSILRLVLGEGGVLIGLGIAVGTLVALAVGRSLDSLLFEVEPGDPLALTAAAALFGGVALAICALPAWRAARIDLMEALRHE